MPVGRPTKIDDEVTYRGRKMTRRALILRAVSRGLSRRKAALAAGVTYQTLKNWQESDEEFFAHLLMAEAQGELEHADNLLSGKPGLVLGARYFLATRKDDPWVERKAVEVEGNLTVAESAEKARAASVALDAAMSSDGEGDG